MPTNNHDYFEGCYGIVYDNGGPNQNYQNNSNSILTIYAPGVESIILQIEEFDIEHSLGCNFDYLAFYDGDSNDSPLINGKKYCNTSGNPVTISSTGEYITIHFVSDEAINRAGYKILFHCENSSIEQNQFDDIVITPNPTKGELRMENGKWRVKNVEIFDIYGRSVGAILCVHTECNEIVIDISNFPAGIYFVKIITTQNEFITKKIVKN